MKYNPDPHQVEAYEHLMANPRSTLFLGMSLSKTVIVLTYLYEMHYREAAITKTLVVAPDKVARITWPDEVEKWDHLSGMRYSLIAGDAKKREAAMNVDAEIYIIGINNLTWLVQKYVKQTVSHISGEPYGPYLGKLPFDCVVLDELSLFKSRDSGRFKCLSRALNKSGVEYRHGLTGTPSPNGYVDLWAQMYLIDDGVRLGETFGKFIDKYFKTRGNGMIVYEYIPNLGAKNIIAKKIQDIALSMQTRDYLKLPELHTVDEHIELSSFDKEVYNSLEEEYALDFLNGGEVTVGTASDLTMKLLQISSGAIYEDRVGDKRATVWHEVNTAKIDALRVLLDTYKEENFIVVYQFRHEIDRIKAAFPYARELRKGAGLKEDFTNWNAGKIRLLIIHPAGAGHGLNLQFGGRRMIWFSITWNLEHYQQTIARLLRRGAIKDIYVHRLVAVGTRDAKVCARLESKDSDQTFLFKQLNELKQRYGGKVRK